MGDRARPRELGYSMFSGNFQLGSRGIESIGMSERSPLGKPSQFLAGFHWDSERKTLATRRRAGYAIEGFPTAKLRWAISWDMFLNSQVGGLGRLN